MNTVVVQATTPVMVSASYGSTESATVNITSCSGMVVPAATLGTGETIWMEDELPPGTGASYGWQWDTRYQASGTQSNELPAATGMHQSYFAEVNPPMHVDNYDQLFAYVLIDPCNPPRDHAAMAHERLGASRLLGRERVHDRGDE